jgi:hypothetical protein
MHFVFPADAEERDADGSGKQNQWPDLPFTIAEIELINSTVSLSGSGINRILPLSFSARPPEYLELAEEPVLAYQGELVVDEHSFYIAATLDRDASLLRGNIHGTADLARLRDNFALLPESSAELAGTAVISADWSLSRGPVLFDRLNAEVLLENLRLRQDKFVLHGAGSASPRLTVAGSGGKYTFSGVDFFLEGSLPVSFGLDGSLDATGPGFAFQGRAEVQPVIDRLSVGGLLIRQSQIINVVYQGTYDGSAADIAVTAAPAVQQKKTAVIHRGEQIFHIGTLTAEAALTWPLHSLPGRTALITIQGSGLEAEMAGARFIVPEMTLKAQGGFQAGENGFAPEVTGTLHMTNGAVALPGRDLEIGGIGGELPFIWPAAGSSVGPGSLRIAEIRLSDSRLGSFAGLLRQQGEGLEIEGKLAADLLAGQAVSIAGRVNLSRQDNGLARFSLSARDVLFNAGQLASVNPGLQALTGSALVDVEADVQLDQGGIRGSMRTDIRDGNFTVGDGLEMRGVRLAVVFPDLPSLRTLPAQELSVATVRMGKVAITDMDSHFQLESPGSLFIEKMSGRWAGGRVFTDAFRLSADQDIETALFCDRLELAAILNQLGLAEAGGQGTLSGRIPLVYGNRELFIDDGFLFTTPDRKGILQIRRSEHLMLGMPSGIPQLSPLHFAGAALRDFEYNWATLRILSEEDNLLLQLQIDGKPREKMPYRFDQQKNVFVPLEKGAPGGIEQPVRLDVNFRVPVNEFFRRQDEILPLLRLFTE